jgi:hypothetical protein
MVSESKKRKRVLDNPRITYHAENRTFDRLFKGKLFHKNCHSYLNHPCTEESLEEIKDAVRQKLDLPPDAVIQLEQLRDGKPIDLEDGEASIRV